MEAIANDARKITDPMMAQKGCLAKPEVIRGGIEWPGVFPKAVVGHGAILLRLLLLLGFDVEGIVTGFLTEVHGCWISTFGDHPSFVCPAIDVWQSVEIVWVKMIYAGFRKQRKRPDLFAKLFRQLAEFCGGHGLVDRIRADSERFNVRDDRAAEMRSGRAEDCMVTCNCMLVSESLMGDIPHCIY